VLNVPSFRQGSYLYAKRAKRGGAHVFELVRSQRQSETWQRRIALFKIALTSWRLSLDPRIKVRGNAHSQGNSAVSLIRQSFGLRSRCVENERSPPGKPVCTRSLNRTMCNVECVIDCVILSEKMVAASREPTVRSHYVNQAANHATIIAFRSRQKN